MSGYLNLQNLEQRLQRMVEQYEKAKAEYVEGLATRPIHTLEWSGSFMSAAARYEMATRYLEGIKEFRESEDTELSNEAYYDIILNDLRKQVLRRAADPSRSTSRMTNYMAEELMVAHAKLLETLERP